MSKRYCGFGYIIPEGRECDCAVGACKASGLGPTWTAPKLGDAAPDGPNGERRVWSTFHDEHEG